MGCWRWTFALATASTAAGCVGQTGGQAVDFAVAAAGPADGAVGQLAFTEGSYDVVLTTARLHVGAIYLDESRPVSGGQATGCYLTGTYVAQQTSPLDVDLLASGPQKFPAKAHGITEPPAQIAQVWLTGGDVNTIADATTILTIAGTATSGATVVPFRGTLTIGANHQTGTSSPAGGDPICKKRIVTPIDVVSIEQTGGLLLTIDPRLFFVGIDFGQIPADPAGGGFAFSDDPSAPQYQPTGYQLFSNLTSTAPYTFAWSDAL